MNALIGDYKRQIHKKPKQNNENRGELSDEKKLKCSQKELRVCCICSMSTSVCFLRKFWMKGLLREFCRGKEEGKKLQL